MKIRPLNDWVVLKLDPLIEQTSSGLIMVEAERQRTGIVLAVGPGCYVQLTVDVGTPDRPQKWKKVWRPTSVPVGAKITFFKENLEHKPGKQMLALLQELGDELGMVRESDILFYENEEKSA